MTRRAGFGIVILARGQCVDNARNYGSVLKGELKGFRVANRKRRTREHVLADLSFNHIERHVLLGGHTLQRIVHDYGLDAMLVTFNRRGEVENGLVWMQIKATDNPQQIKGQGRLAVRVERKHLLFWIGELFPVILVVYDATRDRAHWLHVQEEFGRGKVFEAARAGTRLTLQVPMAQVLDHEAISEFRQRKRAAQAQFAKEGV